MMADGIGHADGAMIAFFLPSLEGGGAERAIVALANNISSSGGVVDLVLANAVGPYLTEVSPAVRVVNLASQGKVATIMRLRRYLMRNRPQTVMSSLDLPNMQLIFAAKLAGFKGTIIFGQRATIAPVYAHCGWMRRVLYWFALRAAYPRADIIICNSHAAAKELRAIPRVRSENIVTIHNSVDTERIQRLAIEPLHDRWFLKNPLPLIVSVGSLTYLKDRTTLVKAFALVKAQRNVRLAIVGAAYDSDERHKIEQLIYELGLTEHVHLVGFDANPFKWMKAAAVLVSSSITEGCPNQILEALALGVAIVATDCPGDTAELLGHGRWGRLVPVGNPGRMANAILGALDDPNPPNGRIRAADFAPSMVTSSYLKVLLPNIDDAAIARARYDRNSISNGSRIP